MPELQEAAMKVLGTLFGDKATQPVASTASAWKSDPYILGMRWLAARLCWWCSTLPDILFLLQP